MQGNSACNAVTRSGLKSRFTDSQILSVLKQAENGVPVPELCREHGMSSATFISDALSSEAWLRPW